jgi:hypothetical protein
MHDKSMTYRAETARRRGKPVAVVKHGSAAVPIYRGSVRGHTRITIAFYLDGSCQRRFDKKRTGRKSSNQDWVNPHDPEAKVGRTKDGACDMVYKPEHISDLESGAIIEAGVRPGDAADNDATLPERVEAARATLQKVLPEDKRHQVLKELCADEGYFAVEPIAGLQEAGVRIVIGDPHSARRRKDKLEPRHHRALHRARSASGKALLRRRGEHLERGFAHVLDHGDLRHATLRGTEKLSERHIIAAMTHNLSLLLRHETGIGTAKQALAAAAAFACALKEWLWKALNPMRTMPDLGTHIILPASARHVLETPIYRDMQNYRFSTGC